MSEQTQSSTAPLTPADLDAIEQRAEKATKGPWKAHRPQSSWHIKDSKGRYILEGSTRRGGGAIRSWPADAEFIAHSREDVVGLIAEVRRLREELAEAARQINCAGPIAHRIRVLKQEHADRLAQLQQSITPDTRRLDAIERNQWNVCPDTGSRWTVWTSQPTGGGDYSEVELTRDHRPASVRAAIDAAMQAPPPAPDQ
jgi:hypothetical protein